MVYELTISDHYTTWGAGGRIFRPGVHLVTDYRIVEAARADPHVIVQEIGDDPSEPAPVRLVEVHVPEAPTGGALSRSDLAVGNEPAFPCADCTEVFRSEAAWTAHRNRVHPPVEEEVATEPAEATQVEELLAVVEGVQVAPDVLVRQPATPPAYRRSSRRR